jgi:hypothetical protein
MKKIIFVAAVTTVTLAFTFGNSRNTHPRQNIACLYAANDDYQTDTTKKRKHKRDTTRRDTTAFAFTGSIPVTAK